MIQKYWFVLVYWKTAEEQAIMILLIWETFKLLSDREVSKWVYEEVLSNKRLPSSVLGYQFLTLGLEE